MWDFLVRNKQVTAMLALLTIAALVVIILVARTSGYNVVEKLTQNQKATDISDDPHLFSCHK